MTYRFPLGRRGPALAVVVRLLAAIAVLAWWNPVPAAVAQAEIELVVEGRIVNGTAGGPEISGQTVVLHEHADSQHDDVQTTTDAHGGFRFEGITYDPNADYGISVNHQGALYGTDLDLSGGSPPQVTLTVYEASDSEALLNVISSSVLIARVEKSAQRIWVLEIVQVANRTDHTYVPGPQPMQLLRFGLPIGSSGLEVDTRLLGADVIQVDRGFALTAGVPPGEHEVMYAYHFPYSGSGTAFTKSFPYGAESVRVLAPYGTLDISADQLGDPEVVSVGDSPYQLLQGGDLPRGSQLSIGLAGLPQSSLGERLSARLEQVPFEYAAPAGLGLLMALVIGLALWRRGKLVPAEDTEALAAERSSLVDRIAGLEQRFEQGEFSETRYHRERATLLAALASIGRRPSPDSD